ncbi:hypothetical protein KM043_016889 [Ampulex compressa]|nr:hypothetical protein KM043_016889 [Ampulex compressa]
MTKKCDDPKCPVNKKHRGKRKVDKKGETESGIRPSPQEVSSKDSYVSCPVHKKTTICKKSKKSTKAYRDRSSNFRNKKCQASKSTVECSTSTCPPRRICIKSQVSLIPNATVHVSSVPARQICNCNGAFKKNCDCKPAKRSYKRTKSAAGSAEQKKDRVGKKSKSKRKVKRKNNRANCFSALCVCVRSPSYEQLRNCNCKPSCEILSKYNQCCCSKDNTNRTKVKNSTSNDRNMDDNSVLQGTGKNSIVNGKGLNIKSSSKSKLDGFKI